jgi:hypothetical protein
MNYLTLLVSVAHPEHGMAIQRYCVGVDHNDPLLYGFDLDHWATPEGRRKLLSLLCEDWLTEDCSIVGCEQISGAVQWQGGITPEGDNTTQDRRTKP